MGLEDTLKTLVSFTSEKPPVVSLYLNVDPKSRTTDEYKLVLRKLLDSVEGHISKDDRERIEQYIFYEFDWKARSLACFSCQGKDLWEVVHLQLPVEDAVYSGHTPYVSTLMNLKDTYDMLGVLSFDREGAKLLVFYLEGAVATDGMLGEEVKRHKQGGWAAARYQRHVDAMAMQNMKEIAEMISQHYAKDTFRKLILSGTEENVAALESLLPNSVRDAIIGRMNLPPETSVAEVEEKALNLAAEASRSEKMQMAQEVVEKAAGGGPGVFGLPATLVALQEGRVYYLLLGEAFDSPIWRCRKCGYLSDVAVDKCPICQGEMIQVPEGAHALVRTAFEQGSRVVVMPPGSALDEHGYIGALLRY